MGIRASLNETGKPTGKPAGKTAAQSNLRMVRLGVDVPLFLALFTLVVFGLLILYSASWDFSRAVREDSDPYYIFNRQLLFDMLQNEFRDATDFGKEIIPQSISKYKVASYQYEGYWEDIGNIPAFFHANLGLTKDPASFTAKGCHGGLQSDGSQSPE